MMWHLLDRLRIFYRVYFQSGSMTRPLYRDTGDPSVDECSNLLVLHHICPDNFFFSPAITIRKTKWAKNRHTTLDSMCG